jgi:hypothetical protein
MELEKRAVEAKGWRWMPGMRIRSIRMHLRIIGRNGDGSYRLSWDDPDRPIEGDNYSAEDLSKAKPDLTDPATIGCLLALVRDAHRDAYMAAGCDGEDWIVADCDGLQVSRGRSEREVLVKALEAAPEHNELEL